MERSQLGPLKNYGVFFAKDERASSKDVPVMVLVPTCVTEEELETYGELMFEKFEAPHSYFQKKVLHLHLLLADPQP